MASRDDEERDLELEEDLDDSFDNPAIESELEAELIEEWCPVCKEIKPHAIIGGDRIACAACNHEHSRDREAFSEHPVKHSVLSDEDKSSEASLCEAWKRLVAQEDESSAQAYSIRLKLAEGDIVRHAKFGIGIVVDMNDSTKAEVLFKDGIRRLVCGK